MRNATIAAILLFACAGTAHAAGGGGGAAPSGSVQSYDPARDFARGTEALQAGDFKAADRAFRKVLAAVPDDPAVLLFAGMAKSGLGDHKAALKPLEKALKINPNAIPARREYAIALRMLGDPRAEAELATLKARAATCADACPEAADLKAAVGAVETAAVPGTPAASPGASLVRPPATLLAGSGAGDAAYMTAVALINEGRYQDAIASLEAARTVFGPHPDILTYIGYAWRKLGQFERAEGHYRQALAVAPEHRGATEYYGELKAERGDIAGARAMLARLDALCSFGCIEAEDLRRWIEARAG